MGKGGREWGTEGREELKGTRWREGRESRWVVCKLN